jgi:NADH-quinone oxidoreductase subunit A
MTPTAIVAYLALFATVGFLFVLASLLLGSVVRAHVPTPQKLDTYECGEPAVGPGSVQFDLRFYVVALVFLIFEVEVAFFFPPATVFGTATQFRADAAATVGCTDKAATADLAHKAATGGRAQEAATTGRGLVKQTANTLALASMLDLGVFFAVLLVGFAYVWSRGDLDWVRAVRHPTTPTETAVLAMRLESDRQP